MSRTHEAEHRKERREWEQILAQLLEAEWQRCAGGVEWSQAAEDAMVQAILARHRPLSHRHTGAILDVTEAAKALKVTVGELVQ